MYMSSILFLEKGKRIVPFYLVCFLEKGMCVSNLGFSFEKGIMNLFPPRAKVC